MGNLLEIQLEEKAYEEIVKMANELGLSPPRMCKHILEEFIHQGRVYVGGWQEGPGKRIIIDYPKYSSRVIKLFDNELE
ncbi:MAG: hypothetical protein ACTSQI_10910 [Candidatus Helarchaeota archaeon]